MKKKFYEKGKNFSGWFALSHLLTYEHVYDLNANVMMRVGRPTYDIGDIC